MTQTVEAILVVAIALLPGAIYLWSVESVVGGWWLDLSDRLYRFVAWSLVLHVALVPLTYAVWTHTVMDAQWQTSFGRFLVLWLALIAYIAIPFAAGKFIAGHWRRGSKWALHIVGDPAPSAWDHLWGSVEAAWVRARMKEGYWIGGLYADAGFPSYASGFPNSPDLYLATAYVINQETGDFQRDDEGRPEPTGSGILIRWEDVEVLDIVPETD